MIRVAGMWELGWNTPIKEVDLWEMMLGEFNVEQFYMTPISGINNTWIKERSHINEILDENRDVTIVFVDERSPITLKEFVHPINVLYVFGKANFSPLLSYKKESDLSVSIETSANLGMLWPHQAASIVLYDRICKCH